MRRRKTNKQKRQENKNGVEGRKKEKRQEYGKEECMRERQYKITEK